jgi:hypothetical protein
MSSSNARTLDVTASALKWFNVDGQPERPVLRGKDLVFTVKVIEGNLPAEGGLVVMFIDPIGRPLSPGSVAGAHRRHRRRAIMRHYSSPSVEEDVKTCHR